MTREAQEIVERLADEAASQLHFKANAKAIAEVLAPVAELIEAARRYAETESDIYQAKAELRAALDRLRDAAGHSK